MKVEEVNSCKCLGAIFSKDNRSMADIVIIISLLFFLKFQFATHLYGLRVINMDTKIHQHLWNEVWHIVRISLDTGAKPKNTSMTLDQLF